MADGAVSVELTGDLASRLTSHAAALGVSPAALAGDMLARLLDDPSGAVNRRTNPSDYEGPFHDLDDVLAEFSDELARRLTTRDL